LHYGKVNDHNPEKGRYNEEESANYVGDHYQSC